MILEDLDMARVNLSGAEVETLAGAVARMRRVVLSHTHLTPAQVDILSDAIAKQEKLCFALDIFKIKAEYRQPAVPRLVLHRSSNE